MYFLENGLNLLAVNKLLTGLFANNLEVHFEVVILEFGQNFPLLRLGGKRLRHDDDREGNYLF